MSAPAFHAVIFLASLQETHDETEAASALLKSREQLSKDGLTGIILLSKSQTLRFVEGEEDTVYKHLSRAIDGPYFKNLQIIFDGSTSERYFNDNAFYSPFHNKLSNLDTARIERLLFQFLAPQSTEMNIVRKFLEELRLPPD